MNVKIEKSELVKIQGLTEAAVASSDIQLITIVNYADLPSSYLTENEFEADRSSHSTYRLVNLVSVIYLIVILCFNGSTIAMHSDD